MNNDDDEPMFQFGASVRTQKDWAAAGPTDLFRLNAELWAAAHQAAAVALEEGGVMVYFRKDGTLDSAYFPQAVVAPAD